MMMNVFLNSYIYKRTFFPSGPTGPKKVQLIAELAQKNEHASILKHYFPWNRPVPFWSILLLFQRLKLAKPVVHYCPTVQVGATNGHIVIPTNIYNPEYSINKDWKNKMENEFNVSVTRSTPLNKHELAVIFGVSVTSINRWSIGVAPKVVRIILNALREGKITLDDINRWARDPSTLGRLAGENKSD